MSNPYGYRLGTRMWILPWHETRLGTRTVGHDTRSARVFLKKVGDPRAIRRFLVDEFAHHTLFRRTNEEVIDLAAKLLAMRRAKIVTVGKERVWRAVAKAAPGEPAPLLLSNSVAATESPRQAEPVRETRVTSAGVAQAAMLKEAAMSGAPLCEI